MQSLTTALLTLVLTAAAVTAARAEEIHVSGRSYAAVAYSPATGEMRYAYNHGSRRAAEEAALGSCTAKDAVVVGWVNRGFFALAVADDGDWRTGWSYGDGATNNDAMDHALKDFRAAGKPARIVICLTSDGQYVRK